MAAAGMAPDLRPSSRPLRIKTKVGIDAIRNRSEAIGSSSVLTLATRNCPFDSAATLTSSGATIRQGGHHGAQKSMRIGSEDRREKVSKIDSECTSIGLVGRSSSLWQPPQRNVWPSRS